MAKRQIPVNAMVEQRSYLSGDLVLQTTETDLKSASKRTNTWCCKQERSRSSGVYTLCSLRHAATRKHRGELRHSTQFRYFFK